MPLLNRNASRKTTPSAELLYLIIVLAAGGATFWYVVHKIGVDLSSISTAAAILGIGQTAVRYEAHAPPQSEPPQVITSIVAEEDSPAAPYCAAGQPLAFANGMADLKGQLGDTMGDPLECEHAAETFGDTVQQTSTGLAVYTRITNTVMFTDGWRHWALSDTGDMVSWEGTQSTPPPI
jgi:hypothetical protein